MNKIIKNERIANISLATAARERALRVHPRVSPPKREPLIRAKHVVLAALLVALWLGGSTAIDKVVAYAEHKGQLAEYAMQKQNEIVALREQLAAKAQPPRNAAEQKMAAGVASLSVNRGAEK